MKFPLSKINIAIKVIIRLLQIIVNVDKSSKETKNGNITDTDTQTSDDTTSPDYQQTSDSRQAVGRPSSEGK